MRQVATVRPEVSSKKHRQLENAGQESRPQRSRYPLGLPEEGPDLRPGVFGPVLGWAWEFNALGWVSISLSPRLVWAKFLLWAMFSYSNHAFSASTFILSLTLGFKVCFTHIMYSLSWAIAAQGNFKTSVFSDIKKSSSLFSSSLFTIVPLVFLISLMLLPKCFSNPLENYCFIFRPWFS